MTNMTPFRRMPTREILGADFTGLQDAINRVEHVLELGTAAVTGHALTAVADQAAPALHRRIYEGTIRGWLETPAPVILRGGVVVPLGEYELFAAQGAVVFHAQQVAGAVITANFTHVTNVSPTHGVETRTRTLDQGLAGRANVGTLSQFLSWFAGLFRAVTGATNWWDAPATTLLTAHNHHGAPAPHTGHETQEGARSRVDTHANLTTAHGISSNTVTTADLNTIVVPGFYRIQAGNPNAPPNSDWGNLIVVRSTPTDTIMQICGGLSPDTLFWRTGSPPQVGGPGAWTPWVNLAGTSAPTANRAILRDAAGRAQVAAPAVAADIARLDTVTAHADLTTAHGATELPTASRLVLRNAAGNIVAANTLRLQSARTIASATAPGEVGEICWDANFVYVCVAANTWRRASFATW